MNKKVTIASITFASLLLLVPAVSADTVNTYSSTGSVGYTASNDPTTPVDPTDPTTPVTPEIPGGKVVTPGTNGPLSIDFASSLDFGVQKITASDATYQASAQGYTKADETKTTGPDYVQITDNRGTFAGWTLSAKQMDDFKTASGVVLQGAQVAFTGANHVSATTGDGVTNKDSFTLTPGGGAIDVMSGAAATTGTVNGTSGTHLLDFGDASSLKTDQVSYNADGTTVARPSTDSAVTLSVPGKSAKVAASYTTTIQWTIGNTPSETIN